MDQPQLITAEETTLAGPSVDINFLPLVYDIIKNLERDVNDPSQRNSQSQDIGQKIQELQKKLDASRVQVQQLPGIEFSKTEQLQNLNKLYKELQAKCKLITKYRSYYNFDSIKL